jgi:hypothetical protein
MQKVKTMGNDDVTRRIGSPAKDSERTRLVRRPGEVVAPNDGKREAVADPSKTRLAHRPGADATTPDGSERPVVGWLVVVSGPGRGRFAAISDGMNSVGRGEDQATRMNFGDESISRSEHAFITYDYKDRKFYIQHGGKMNVVRLNEAPVLQPMALKSGDMVSLGQTTARFVPFCDESFDWND